MYLYDTSNIKYGYKPEIRNIAITLCTLSKFRLLIIKHMLPYLFFAAPIIDTTSNTFDRR